MRRSLPDAERLRRRRLADFRRRADFAPESVYRHPERGWEYIPVHPFADETDILEKLGLGSDDCTSADVWWCTGEDRALLCGIGAVDVDAAGLYARVSDHEDGSVNLTLRTTAPTITRVEIEAAMTRLAELGFPNTRPFSELRRGTTARLADWS